MIKLDLDKLHDFAWCWLVEGEKDNKLTSEQLLFLYDIMVVLNKVKQNSTDIIINDEKQRNAYIEKYK